MNELATDIARRIAERGPLPFAAYMSIALYDPVHGYYSTEPRTGWRGQFVTSPELDPAFGSLWATGAQEVWDRCGRPENFVVVEIGPGEGSFADAVLDATTGRFGDALRYILVERTAAGRRRQATRIADPRTDWVAALDELETVPAGMVVANEVIDNLPFHIVERHGDELIELYVGVNVDGNLVEIEGDPSTPELALFLERHGMTLDDGHRAEVSLATEGFVRQAAGVIERGSVVLIDYGAMGEDLALRPRGTLACYSAAGVDDLPLDEPGTKDITAHGNWSAVMHSLAAMQVIGPRPQADVLRALGAAALDTELEAVHARALEEGRGADAVAALSRRQALRVLLDPGGLGGLDVVVGLRGIDPPPFLA
ncbi:MAG TPA: SAM-dependent methyltransferase [Actinomycetota bacterium]|nr:SAM-dependent methyltransferase [Actinomycetota bacterium]